MIYLYGLFLLFLLCIAILFGYKFLKISKERDFIFLKSLDSISNSLKEIQYDFRNFVCEYVKPKD